MIVPYALRLLFVGLASFFLVNLALALATRLLAPLALRVAEKVAARDSAAAAGLVFVFRVAPAALALAAVAVLFVPSFLSFEGQRGEEAAGVPFLAAAIAGAAVWAVSLARALRAVVRSRRCVPRHSSGLPGAEGVVLLNGPAPFLGLTGVFRPRVVISRSVASALDPDQLDAALRHERAHRASRDNLKRLLLLLSPEPLPGVSLLRSLDAAWARLAEWAADDQAVAQDAQLSIPLAEALVRVARLGVTRRAGALVSPFVLSGEDISTRVDRLLNRTDIASRKRPRRSGLLAAATAAPFLATAFIPGSLNAVHQVLEQLMH